MSEECCAHAPSNPLNPSSPSGAAGAHVHSDSGDFWKAAASLGLAMVSMLAGMPGLVGAEASSLTWGLSLAASLAVCLGFGLRFFRAIPQVFRSGNMNTLIGIGILASYALSFWFWSRGDLHHVYFDTAAFVAAFVLLGQWVESALRRRIQKELPGWVEILPSEVHRLEGDSTKLVALTEIRVGDRLRVMKGARVPVDGKLISASATLDESLVTGESQAVTRSSGQSLVQGALNLENAIDLEVTQVAAHSFYRNLVASVQKSLSEKSPAQKRADQWSRILIPLVILVSVGAGVYWGFFQNNLHLMVMSSVSVLVIACPCALGIATPLALWVALVRCGRKGILLKNLSAIEKSGDVSVIAFDKTGTLTQGQPELTRVLGIENISHKDVVSWALALEMHSDHPVAGAIKRYASKENLKPVNARSVKLVPGKGLVGELQVSGKWVSAAVGNLVWMYENGVESTEVPEALRWESEGTSDTCLWVLLEGKIQGLILLADPLRPEAKQALSALDEEGYELGLITGDSELVAKSVAKALGLKFYHYGVLPAEKATLIKRLSEKKKKGFDVIYPKVAFVGDGLNDGPALAEAHLGVAMGSGTALAQMSADVILLNSRVPAVKDLFEILGAARSLVTQNLFLAFGFNVIAIPVAAGVLIPWTGFFVDPAMAALAMSLSSVGVLVNSVWALRRAS